MTYTKGVGGVVYPGAESRELASDPYRLLLREIASYVHHGTASYVHHGIPPNHQGTAPASNILKTAPASNILKTAPAL